MNHANPYSVPIEHLLPPTPDALAFVDRVGTHLDSSNALRNEIDEAPRLRRKIAPGGRDDHTRV